MSDTSPRPRPAVPRAAVPAIAFGTDGFFFTEWARVTASDQPAVTTAGLALYLAIGPAALSRRAVAPRSVFALVWVWAAVGALWLPTRPAVTLLLALYALTVRSSLRDSLVALVSCTVPVTIGVAREVVSHPDDRRQAVLMANIVLNVAVAVSVSLIGRQAHRREQRVTQLEAAQASIAREAVAAERRRLAGELHDIVSHAVSIMVLQAAGAGRLLPEGSDEIANALGVIERKGQEAMAELRRLLAVLRDAGHVPPVEHEQQGVGQLHALARSFTDAGLPVELTATGEARELDPSLDLTAFRVVQEALTNTMKHGGAGARATVTLHWAAEANELVIDVTDTGRPVATADASLSTGTGLIGLRERVRALGGTLTTSPGPSGRGFQVRALLPVSPTTRRPAERPPGGGPGDEKPDRRRTGE